MVCRAVWMCEGLQIACMAACACAGLQAGHTMRCVEHDIHGAAPIRPCMAMPQQVTMVPAKRDMQGNALRAPAVLSVRPLSCVALKQITKRDLTAVGNEDEGEPRRLQRTRTTVTVFLEFPTPCVFGFGTPTHAFAQAAAICALHSRMVKLAEG